jgi:hypothetical protein
MSIFHFTQPVFNSKPRGTLAFNCAAAHRLRTTAPTSADSSVAHTVASARTDRILIPKLQALVFQINLATFKDNVPTPDYKFTSQLRKRKKI